MKRWLQACRAGRQREDAEHLHEIDGINKIKEGRIGGFVTMRELIEYNQNLEGVWQYS
jgi:hypothetical protein